MNHYKVLETLDAPYFMKVKTSCNMDQTFYSKPRVIWIRLIRIFAKTS